MGQFGFKNQGAQRPTAMGSLLQSSAYGATIPVIYGQTQSPLLAIWAANLRNGGGSLKKFKQFKKGITNYEENIDFLLGHNPIMGVLQVMVNGGNYPLNFTSMSFEPAIDFLGGTFVIDDDNFDFVIAVTRIDSYSFDVDDFGGQGPATLTGTFETPFWNELETGPDPTGNSGYRNAPDCYRWQPSYGNTVYMDFLPPTDGTVTYKVYYAQLMDATSYQPPITKLALAFENELGNGDEYSEAPSPFNEQQIIYPQFAGLGGADFNLGASGTIPQMLPEVRGKWGIYPSGDGDFCDMIEDIFKSGLAQAAIGAETAYTQMERGLSSYDLPGCVQIRQMLGTFFGGGLTFTGAGVVFNMPNTAGNFLVCAINVGNGESSTLTISSANGETWTKIFADGLSVQAWYAIAVGGANSVTVDGGADNSQMTLLEIAGVDTFDNFVHGANGAASITTTNAPGFAGYILAINLAPTPSPPFADPGIVLWDAIVDGPQPPSSNQGQLIQERLVYSPGTYSIQNPAPATSVMALIAFKATTPAIYPMPLGDFIDLPSLDLVRTQCRANGLWGSLSMSSQSAASDWLKSLYAAADAAPVFLGNKLFSYPYSEVSIAGNGAEYTAPTASGPIANLSDVNGDYVGSDGCPVRETVSRIDQPNVLQMQCVDRNANYNQVVVQQPDAASIALYGVRKADPIVNNAVQDPSIARALLGIQVRKNQYGGDGWEFKLSARWSLLSPMDLVTLTDTIQGLAQIPVRITEYTEEDDASFSVVGEPFVYGMYSPVALPATTPTQNGNNTQASAGDVNAPVIFEAVPDLYPTQAGDQLWLVISSSNPIYGGAAVFISTDGGSSYVMAPGLNGNNIASGNAVTGVTTSDWPAAADPDSTNDLPLDLTESNGVLQSYPTTAENNFEYPCYVEGDGSGLDVNGTQIATGPFGLQVSGTDVANVGGLQINGTDVAAIGEFGYELMTYAVADLTSANHFTLKATGSGNFLRRAVFGAPDSSGQGVDHPSGSRFALLSPAGIGILKMNLPAIYIGQTLYFKICSFNSFGTALQSLSDVAAYSYIPTGVPGMV